MSALRFDWNASRNCAALFDGCGAAGWLRSGAIGFRGFATASDAAQAALLAYSCAVEQLRRVGVDIGSGVAGRSLTTSREGGRDWIRVGGRVVAWMLPPSAVPGSGLTSYGFELVVPRFLPVGVVADLAREAHTMLRRTGAVGAFAPVATGHDFTQPILVGELT